MTNIRSVSFITGVSSLAIFTLFSVLLSISVILGQTAHAQESSIGFLYEPGIEALTAFATGVAESAPKIIAAVILLIIGLIAGKVIGKVVEKSASKLLQKVTRNNENDDIVTQTTSSRDSSKLIAASVRWFVYLFFIIAAINALEFEQLSTALTDLWLWVPNLLAFILIVVVGLIIVNFIGKWLDQELIKKEFGGSKYVIIGVKTVIYAIIFAVALTQLGIGDTIIPILVSAFAWSIAIGVGAAIAIGLGFTLKDILPAAINTAAKQRSVLKIGQKIRIGEVSGTITAVELLHIVIANENNESTIVPTKELNNSYITIIGETHD
ncbi:MAG: mechanosensitive ion channel [Nitrosopumilus sp.]|nr:mechanosensitive ion channel [Nitrosopumilus sp.]MDH3488564.1 mechanosensitive ion channel [Nitrosopumilus sp.]